MRVRVQLASGKSEDATNFRKKIYSLIPLASMKFDLLVLHLQWCNFHGESRTEMFLPMGCFCLRMYAFCYSILIAGVAWPNTIAELKLHEQIFKNF